MSGLGLGPVFAVKRPRGGDHGGAQAGSKGGGGQGNRSWAQTRVCVGATAGGEVCTRRPKRTALPPLRPRARSKPPRRGHGGAADRNATSRSDAGKGDKGPASPSGLGRARVGVHACARVTCLHGRAREHERAGVGPHRWPGWWWHTTA
jgi:hypothetical protein